MTKIINAVLFYYTKPFKNKFRKQMDINVSLLPSGGYGYTFPTIRIKPMNFREITEYIDNVPENDPLGHYLFDIQQLIDYDPNIKNVYMMDLDFLIFYRKLCTVSDDLKYQVTLTCPHCGKSINKTINFGSDLRFKQIDPKIMEGAKINLGGHGYEVIIPTVSDFMKVFKVYMRYKKITDIKMIKTIALIKDFDIQANQVEEDVIGATHSDITLLMALRDLYYERLEPLYVTCSECDGGKAAVNIDGLIVDFFRDLYVNSPIDGTKIVFK